MDRSLGAYLLFAIGFLGFMIAAGGIVISSPGTTLAGFVLLLLTVLAFGLRGSGEGNCA